eukprot:CAMPEP_0203807274 /NCGR_PEP_ID=MMETSP0115-20131106/971_1 /ASSEMBLY_ACC=CAM_ASM_000227 /TAXON_ID=33651 /ORGANISM="Bicosoecid sp, Strain ms1" /LENGTH=251 /DNA_ID=CAMNT_0050715949 /DNA_START=13 /DNA_END=765 /DNA_ORIENTATION=-
MSALRWRVLREEQVEIRAGRMAPVRAVPRNDEVDGGGVLSSAGGGGSIPATPLPRQRRTRWVPKWTQFRERRLRCLREAVLCDAVAGCVGEEGDDERRDAELIAAVQRGDCDDVRRLLAAGADIMVRHLRGDTPLHLAARDSTGGMVALLLSAGADDRAKNNDRESPYSVAARTRNVDAMAAIRAWSFAGSDMWALLRHRHLLVLGRAELVGPAVAAAAPAPAHAEPATPPMPSCSFSREATRLGDADDGA